MAILPRQGPMTDRTESANNLAQFACFVSTKVELAYLLLRINFSTLAHPGLITSETAGAGDSCLVAK